MDWFEVIFFAGSRVFRLCKPREVRVEEFPQTIPREFHGYAPSPRSLLTGCPLSRLAKKRNHDER